MAIESIAKTLGSGSGIDVGALVTSLVEAQFAIKTKQLDARAEKLEAQISGVSTLRSTLSSFDAALKALVGGGTLQSRLVSSNEAVLKATPLDATATPDVSATLRVDGLASAQISTTNAAYAPGAQFRRGTLTLRMGRDTVDANGAVTGFTPAGAAVNISITDADRTLAGIAAKINAANAGVTARVVADGAGERLSIAGASGAAQAFELSAADSGGAGGGATSLTALTVNRTATQTASPTRARDAVVTVDGVRFNRTSNTITDLVPGVTLELTGVSASAVTVGTARQPAALSEAVSNFVAAYNETLGVLNEVNDPLTGVLAADNAVETAARSLARLTTETLVPASAAGGPRTLADLGVRTARDGTLSVDPTQLARAVQTFPAAVERIFTSTGPSGSGLAGALSTIVRRVNGFAGGLGSAGLSYGDRQRGLEDARTKAAEQAETLRERLTRQFSTMDARVSAYKSTQSFLDNQIKAWNRSDA